MAKKYDSILQSIITKLSKLLVPASKTSYGLMSPTDKTKLDDIKDEVSISDTEPAADSGVKLWVPSADDAISVPLISDDEISKEDTWSSEKINNMVSLIYPESKSYITDLPETPVVGDYFVSIADYWTSGKTQSFPYPFGLFSVRYGSYTGEYTATFCTTGDDHKIYYNTWRSRWEGWRSITDKSDLPNPNLLINPDFRINQRAKTTYNGTNGYCVDAWIRSSDATVNVVGDGIAMSYSSTSNPAVFQSVNFSNKLYGKPITFSASINGTVYSCSCTPTAGSEGTILAFTRLDGETDTPADNSIPNIYIQMNSRGIIQCVLNNVTKCEWAKLEIGTVATPFTPPNPEEELLKCRERYQTFNGTLVPYYKTNNIIEFSIPTPHRADGTAFTASFKDISSFSVAGGLALYDARGNVTKLIPISSFSMKYNALDKSYYIDAPLPSDYTALNINNVFLLIGYKCPIEFTNE